MKILVLLSTYNGEKYLQEQLNSLYSQTVPVDVLVRDDGSSDNTRVILEENGGKIKYYFGENIGFCGSFSDLVKTAPNDYDYYLFCDQDDYWLPEKVAVAVDKLSKMSDDLPSLYLSSVRAVDVDLNSLSERSQKRIDNITLENALLKSYGNGCTMAFDRKLKEYYSKIDKPDMVCHDWLMLQLAALFGRIYYDNDSYILYRQHTSNAIGSKSKSLRKKIKKAKHTRAKEARFVLDNYSDLLSDSQVKTVKRIAEIKKIKNRLHVLFSKRFCTGNLKTTFAVKAWAVLGIL